MVARLRAQVAGCLHDSDLATRLAAIQASRGDGAFDQRRSRNSSCLDDFASRCDLFVPRSFVSMEMPGGREATFRP